MTRPWKSLPTAFRAAAGRGGRPRIAILAEYAAAVRLPAAHRGMLKAAEVLAATAIELLLYDPLRKRAVEEFRAARGKKRYNLPKRGKIVPLPSVGS
ncbi:MAG: hypothetical protein JXA11_12840 [Phycisphaerae bacterium]|nr:hypothetical protein [Phycisphaerae bacterium]